MSVSVEADCLPGPEPQQVLCDPPQHLRGHAPQRLDGAAGEHQGNLSSPVVMVTGALLRLVMVTGLYGNVCGML